MAEHLPKHRILTLIGPPGVGKGTIAELLVKKLGIPHISTGDLFRNAMNGRHVLDKKIGTYMRKNKFVPDSITLPFIFHELTKRKYKNGVILDGFPRTLVQAKALETHAKNTPHVDLAILLNAPTRILQKRLSSRMICATCRTVFNIHSRPPKLRGICDVCGGALVWRDDDKPTVVLQRLRDYKQLTAPIVRFYCTSNRLIQIDADATPKVILHCLIEAIAQKGF